MNLNIGKILLILLSILFLPILTIKVVRSEPEDPRPRWVFRYFLTDHPYYEMALPEGSGQPRFFYCPKNKDDWYEAQLTTVTFEDVPWLRWGIGGSGERERWFNQRPEGRLYLTIWHDDRINLGSDWSLRSEVELRYWLAEWNEAALIVHQLSLNYQKGDLGIGPILVGELQQGDDYLAIGGKITYSPLSWLELSLEGYPFRSSQAPEERLILGLIF